MIVPESGRPTAKPKQRRRAPRPSRQRKSRSPDSTTGRYEKVRPKRQQHPHHTPTPNRRGQ